ncbi:MAG: glycosyltransferase family 4 protein [Paludibacter sp.]|nr:glycosyltransferase family 4 protein [Paludibacter sp.]
MKILFVNFTKFWGGGEYWTSLVMDGLKKRNHSVALFSNTQSKLHLDSQRDNIETYAFSVGKFTFLNLLKLSKIQKTLIDIKPDAIILNSNLELKTIGLLIKASGCSKVIFTRGIPSPMKMKPLKRYLFSNVVSDFIVNSIYVRKSVANVAKLLKNEPTVIYHGIDPDSIVFSECNTKNIAIIGRLSHEKGVDVAIRVMQKVLIPHPDAKLWILGDGKEKENLRNLASELGIQNSVKFWGFQQPTEVDKLLTQCSMLILASRWEGFGLVLLEAMKFKLPSLAFDHTAANEIIIDSETGFLIPEMDIELMSEKAIYLLSNPEVGKQMGEKGNELLKQKFTIEKSLNQYEKLIENN